MRGATWFLALAFLVTASLSAWSQTNAPYSASELDELLGPIALYPDPLVAQILPAATFPDQLQDAYQAQLPMDSLDTQSWYVSVRAVAHYPSVLRLMASSPDWTAAIGQAYVNQPADVMASIQRLRMKARQLGYLSSNSYQTVSVTNGYVSIVPAQPQYVYVPAYSPSVVYVERRPSYGSWVTFGAGLLIGAWLNNAIDWGHHRVYYHGWHGGGWIGRSRSHVRTNDRYYTNPAWSNRTITGNRDIRSRDITNYRRDVQRNRGKYSPPGLVTATPGTTVPGSVTPGRTTRHRRQGVAPGEPSPGTTPTTPNVRPVPRRVPSGSGPAVTPARPVRPTREREIRPHGVVPTTPSQPTQTRRSHEFTGRGPRQATPAAPVVRQNQRQNGRENRVAPSTSQRSSRPPEASKEQKAK